MPDDVRSETLSIQMLGEFKVAVSPASSAAPKFRSRTAELLLVVLALRLGRSTSKAELTDLLWPDSDGDRQAQNLRRAVSDVRQVIEEDSRSSIILLSQGDRVWLDADRTQTDVRQFKALTDAGLEGLDAEQNLREAVQLYSGPLLPGHSESSLQVHRMELEERFSQAVERLISILLESDRHDEALRVGRHAVVAAPLREDVHVSLMQAYASAGMKSQAIRQFEELEFLLNEQWGEPPSPSSLQAFESLEVGQRNVAIPLDSKAIAVRETPGGAMPVRSPFYVVRDCDRTLQSAVGTDAGTILIHGPRQVGKTSLLSRVLNDSRTRGLKVAVTDFQVLSRSQLATGDSLARALAYGFATQLGVSLNFADLWNEWIGPNSNLDTVVGTVLQQVDGSVIWAMDEADLLFGVPYADDFFGLIRGWFNRRAMDESGPFSRLTVIISYATEAHLFIQDINQSPFNVGLRIPIRDFDARETRELCARYGAIVSEDDVQRIVATTGGQPFLTRKALDAIVHEGSTLEDVEANAAGEDGPFAEHLKRLLFVASRDDGTKAEVMRFLHNKPFDDPKIALRLIAGGMLIRKPGGILEFRVHAYREYLSRYLIGPQ